MTELKSEGALQAVGRTQGKTLGQEGRRVLLEPKGQQRKLEAGCGELGCGGSPS